MLQLSLPAELAAEAEWLVGVPAVSTVESASEGEGDGDDEETSAASTIVGLLPLLLIVVAVYFLFLRPRQRQMKQQRELQSNLDVGDEVMLTSGVYGFVTGIEEGSDVVWVEIDDDVQIRVARAAVSGKVLTGTGTSGAPGGAAGTTEATTAPPAGASRRPTLKGSPPKDSATAAGEVTTDEPAGTSEQRPDTAE
jgi:preprotein translocase subunit YajC